MRWQPPRTIRTLDDPVSGFQVLGERNSGTNFVSRLLAENLGNSVVPRDIYGWKHGFIDRRYAPDPGLLTVLVYRHPLRWLQSVHQKPLNLAKSMQGLSFSEFLNHPWQGAFLRDDGTEDPSTADMEPKTKATFANPMRARTAKIAYFEKMAEMPARMVYLRFEDVNRDPQSTLAAIAEAFDLQLRPFMPVEGFKGQARKPYIPKLMPNAAAADLARIRAELDLKQEAQIGYSLEDLPQFDGLPFWDNRSLRAISRKLKPRFGGTGRRGKV